jgi:dolichol-phosphate mannosyltransferase
MLLDIRSLRRIAGGAGEVSRRIKRMNAAAAIVTAVDLLAYFAATGAGTSAGRGQVIGFMAAAALNYLLLMRTQIATPGRHRYPTLHWHLVVVGLMAFFLRSGVFALLTNGWGWSGHIAILFAAIATETAIRPGNAYCVSVSEWALGSGPRWRALALGVVVLAFALRLIYCGQVELLPEEAYYWNYSRHLDFGYLDHPPMVGWLIRMGTAAFGDTEFGVRLGALCCGAISTLFIYRLTRNLFGEPSGLVAVVLFQTLPFFFLTGMLMTPDAPLTAAWAAALYFFERALIGGRSAAWWGAGVCLGLGLQSKYTILLLGLSTFIFMLLDAPSRRWLRRGEPYGAALLAVAIFSPVIVWNAQHEWASFVFQTSRRLAESPRFALHKLIASALVLLTPTGLVAAAVLLVGRPPIAVAPEGSEDKRRAWRFIQVSILVPLAVFAAFSLRHEVKLDWTGAPWVAVVPGLAFGIVHSGDNLAKGLRGWLRKAWPPTITVMLLIYGAGLYDLALGIPGLGYSKHTELIPVGWRDLSTQINAIADDIGKAGASTPLIVGMDRYAIASELAFYAPDRAKSVAETSSAHLFGQIGLMYERWFPLSKQRGRTLLLVAWSREDLAAEPVKAGVERLGPIEEGVLKRDNGVIRRYYYRLAYGYRGSLRR